MGPRLSPSRSGEFLPPRAVLARRNLSSKQPSRSLLCPQNGGARNRIILQRVERAICVAQRKNLHVRLNRNRRRNTQKIFTILPCVVRYASNHPLLIEQI